MDSDIRAQARHTVLYANVGPELFHYDVDVAAATLTRRSSIKLPAGIMYAWPHATNRFLYVTTSDRKIEGGLHQVHALRIDPATGVLQAHGEPARVAHSPSHISTDVPSQYILLAYPRPSRLTVHRINDDGSVGSEVRQPEPLDMGIHAHQIRLTSGNDVAFLCTRGENAVRVPDPNAPKKFSYQEESGAVKTEASAEPITPRPEQPGAIKVFTYKQGILTPRASIAPKGGLGFGSRHLDFVARLPWVYVSLERQNKLYVFKREGNSLSVDPVFVKDTLADPATVRQDQKQMSGAIHMHPNGRFVYVANRAYALTEMDGQRVFSGGENTIAVYAINQTTGEPTLIQSVDTRGHYARTFSLDSSGHLLVAANAIPLPVRTGSGVTTVAAGLSLFHIGDDGRLEYARKYDVDVGRSSIFWMGMLGLP